MAGLKRDKRDVLFSLVIRERDGWTCKRCEKHFPEGNRAGLDCSHFWGRARRGTRWLEENCDSLCMGCHTYFGAHPALYKEWKLKQMGSRNYSLLAYKARRNTKYTDADLGWIYEQLKSRYREITGRDWKWPRRKIYES